MAEPEVLEAEAEGVPCPLFWMALAAAVGILTAWFVPLAPWIPAGVFLLAGLGVWIGPGRMRSLAVLFGVAAASALWLQARALSLPEDHVARWAGDEALEAHLRFEVLEDPIVRTAQASGSRWDFRARVTGRNTPSGWVKSGGIFLCRLEGSGAPAPAYGDTLEGRGYLLMPRPPDNPGQFDYAAWLRTHGILHEFHLADGDWSVAQQGGGWWIQRRAVAFKHHMLRLLSVGLEDRPEASGLMSAMLFGFRDGVAEPVEEAFRVTGTMHLFAVSGQNVGIILGMLVLVLRSAGLIRWRWSWTVMPLVLIFCLSTGMQPSAFRAFVMAALVSVGWSLYRPVGLFNVLGAAALFMFAWDPRVLFDLGFQLSFIVLLGIAWLTPPLLERWVRWGAPDPWIPRRLLPWWRVRLEKAWRTVGVVVCVSFSAWLASLLHGIVCFHLFAPVALLANIVVVPLAGAVLVLGAVSVVSGSVWVPLSGMFNTVSAFLLQTMVGIISLLASWPGGHSFVGLPWNQPPAGIVRMTVLHDRQASPVVLQAGGQSHLIDPGPEASWNHVANPFRRWQGIDRWDSVVLTNGGARRMGSAASLLEQMPVVTWVESGWRSRSSVQHAWLDGMAGTGKGKTFWREGDRIEWPVGWTVEVFWPGRDMALERLEDRGLVFRAFCAGGSVLFAGDVSAEVERAILERGVDVRADVLLQGEHSRTPNLSTVWLESVRPRWLVRPGRGFQPDRSMDAVFWEDVRRLGITVLVQDRTGAVTVDFAPEGIRVVPFRPQAQRPMGIDTRSD